MDTKFDEKIAQASQGIQQPEADSGHDYSMPAPHATTGGQFGGGVIGPATLSMEASLIAVDKATDAATKQFANFELREAIAVIKILNSLDVNAPPMSAEAQSLLETLQTVPAGVDFDKAYITAQVANHEFLRDLAESYISSPAVNADPEETQVRNLATLALTAFKEHVVLAKNIVQTIAA